MYKEARIKPLGCPAQPCPARGLTAGPRSGPNWGGGIWTGLGAHTGSAKPPERELWAPPGVHKRLRPERQEGRGWGSCSGGRWQRGLGAGMDPWAEAAVLGAPDSGHRNAFLPTPQVEGLPIWQCWVLSRGAEPGPRGRGSPWKGAGDRQGGRHAGSVGGHSVAGGLQVAWQMPGSQPWTHWGSVHGNSCSTETHRSGCSAGRAPSGPPCPQRPAGLGCPTAPRPHGKPGRGGWSAGVG